MSESVVVAITGASGVVYAIRLLELLTQANQSVHLSISPAGRAVIAQELEIDIDLATTDGNGLVSKALNCTAYRRLVPEQLTDHPESVIYHHFQHLTAPIASGSFLTAGLVVCPCSGSTLSAFVTGASNNLIHRAADVHLKERRKVILVPRETPLSSVHLDNMKRACDAGAIVLPAMPGWYHGVESLQDLVDFVVSRILDHLGIRNSVINRWGVQDAS